MTQTNLNRVMLPEASSASSGDLRPDVNLTSDDVSPNVTTKIPSYSEHADSLVLVSRVAIGVAQVTVTQDKKKRGRPPKKPDESVRHSYKKWVTRLYRQCVSSNRSETEKACKGNGGGKFCLYLNSQDLGLGFRV